MLSTSKEARVILALEAIENNPKLSIRAAAKLYNILASTLCRRRSSQPIRYNILANSRNLTDLEEQTIVQYVIKLSIYVFPPILYNVEDIANYL